MLAISGPHAGNFLDAFVIGYRRPIYFTPGLLLVKAEFTSVETSTASIK